MASGFSRKAVAGAVALETRGQFTIHATATYRAALPMTVQIEKARKGMWAAPASATSASPISGTHDNSSAGGPRSVAMSRSVRHTARRRGRRAFHGVACEPIGGAGAEVVSCRGNEHGNGPAVRTMHREGKRDLGRQRQDGRRGKAPGEQHQQVEHTSAYRDASAFAPGATAGKPNREPRPTRSQLPAEAGSHPPARFALRANREPANPEPRTPDFRYTFNP